MATNIEVFEIFLTPMKRTFGRPPHAADQEEAAALADYADALRPFSADALESGWKEIRDTYTGRMWPVPAVCVKACRSAAKDVRETAKDRHPDAVSGRIIDGAWQPWVGCNCARCSRSRVDYRFEDAKTFGKFSPWHPEFGQFTPIERERLDRALGRGVTTKAKPLFAATAAELALRESALRTERAEKLSAKLPRYVPGANE